MDKVPGVSQAFQAFLDEAPRHSSAWMAAVQALDGANALDRKTSALAAYRAAAGSERLALQTIEEEECPRKPPSSSLD